MVRLLINAACVAIIAVGGASTLAAEAGEEGEEAACSETNYFNCKKTPQTCTAHQPCSVTPGDEYTGCSGIKKDGWYSRIKFNGFNCSA